jgi:hypothetical protein
MKSGQAAADTPSQRGRKRSSQPRKVHQRASLRDVVRMAEGFKLQERKTTHPLGFQRGAPRDAMEKRAIGNR